MSYAVYGDVQAEFKDITFSSTTKVKDTEVTEFIVQADALIDAKVGMKYETPVTASGSLPILKMICIMLVSSRVKKILQVKTPEAEKNQEAAPDESRLAMKMLEEISSGKLPLPGATLATSHDGVASYNVDEGICHTFKKGEDQW